MSRLALILRHSFNAEALVAPNTIRKIELARAEISVMLRVLARMVRARRDQQANRLRPYVALERRRELTFVCNLVAEPRRTVEGRIDRREGREHSRAGDDQETGIAEPRFGRFR